jgi:hypothetical protein
MTSTLDLVDRYIAIWNETDAQRRAELIAATWTEDSRYVDPLMSGQGRAGIDAMVAGVQSSYPGLKFRRTSAVDAYADRLRFGWELGPDGGPAVAGGADFGQVAQGRLATVTGFLDFAPAA